MRCYKKNIQSKNKFALCSIIILFSAFFNLKLLADTHEAAPLVEDNVNLFDADNSGQGIKNNRPVDLSIDQDTLLGVVGDLKALLDFNPEHAGAVELAAGPKVLRGNATYAFALNDTNRLKVTGEYLDENLDFDFYTGDTRQWMNQAAVGAAYQHWLGGGTFKDLQIGGYYSHAGSKNLSDRTIDLGDGTTLLDQRRIAGGTDWNGTMETGLKLWSHSLITAGADYDRVRYDTRYEIHEDDTGDAQGFGGHVNLQQLLGPSTQLELQSTVTQLANIFGSGLNWIWTTHNTTAWRTGLESTYTSDHTTGRNFWINSLSLNVVWDEPHANGSVAHYSDPDISSEDLLTWAATPAVRMPDVLAISDERITKVDNTHLFVSTIATCPSPTDLEYNPTNETYYAPGGGEWTQIYPLPSSFSQVPPDDLTFLSAGIMAENSGQIQCEYRIKSKEKFLLANSAYNLVQPVGSNWAEAVPPGWPPVTPPVMSCIADSSACPFETVSPQPPLPNRAEVNQTKKLTDWRSVLSNRAP